jgi:zinc transporter 9
MRCSSFLAGSLPLSLSLSQSQLRLISTIGMGVLVGTSLIVIIPEGVETLYSASDFSSSHKLRTRDTRWLSHDNLPYNMAARSIPEMSSMTERAVGSGDLINAMPGPVISSGAGIDAFNPESPPKTPTTPGVVGALNEPGSSTPLNEDPHKPHHTPHAWIGVSLVLGFILMYLIDTLPSLRPTPPQRTHNVYSLSDLSSTSPPSPSVPTIPKAAVSTTIGLVIHAAADGIALGASSSQPSLSFIIFIAIMIHKAPAAFGLTSVLLKQGLGKRMARAHLLAFSLAAPVGALATWFVVRLLGAGGVGLGGEESLQWWTGVLLLFSGGTFL